mmetsp:Transcript_1474/g.2792  ORF Transcript_1474/g.2792 Transcript_1474/m.2792 type:complete len:300 (-) Transcript_1474:327-1226(-)
MARNEEKAQSMLNRFVTAKQEQNRKPKERRPVLASDCDNIIDAEKWRQQILREIGKKVTEIQNSGLGEHRLRELNDEINKLIREKGHWERRIKHLGGADFTGHAIKILDAEGNEVPATPALSGGYRYFGASRELAGVRELFRKQEVPLAKRSRYEMYKGIDADYYGYRDDEDGVLSKLEVQAERAAVSDAVKEWEREQSERAAAQGSSAAVAVSRADLDDDTPQPDTGPDGARSPTGAAAAAEESTDDGGADGGPDEGRFVAYVKVPSQGEMEKVVLEKKKQALLEQLSKKHPAAADNS